MHYCFSGSAFLVLFFVVVLVLSLVGVVFFLAAADFLAAGLGTFLVGDFALTLMSFFAAGFFSDFFFAGAAVGLLFFTVAGFLAAVVVVV
jgi:hypothetical protein